VRGIQIDRWRNRDEAEVVSVRVTYDADRQVTVEEMQHLTDLLWQEAAEGEQMALTFQDDTDLGYAAE
jgi:hypothetical protein